MPSTVGSASVGSDRGRLVRRAHIADEHARAQLREFRRGEPIPENHDRSGAVDRGHRRVTACRQGRSGNDHRLPAGIEHAGDDLGLVGPGLAGRGEEFLQAAREAVGIGKGNILAPDDAVDIPALTVEEQDIVDSEAFVERGADVFLIVGPVDTELLMHVFVGRTPGRVVLQRPAKILLARFKGFARKAYGLVLARGPATG